MSLRLGYGTNGLTDLRLDDALGLLADLGYDGVGLTLDHMHLDPLGPGLSARVDRLATRLQDLGLAVTVETGARYVLDARRKHGPSLLDADSAARAARTNLLVTAAQIAGDLGAHAVHCFSGTRPPTATAPAAGAKVAARAAADAGVATTPDAAAIATGAGAPAPAATAAARAAADAGVATTPAAAVRATATTATAADAATGAGATIPAALALTASAATAGAAAADATDAAGVPAGDAAGVFVAAATDPAVEIAWQRLDAGLQPVLSACEQAGVPLAIEPEPGHLVACLADFHQLRRRLGDPPALGLTLDIGHCQCLEPLPPAACVRQAAPWLRHVQIEDMRRGVHEHLPFGDGEIDFPPVLAALRDCGYQGLTVVELPRHSHAGPELAAAAVRFLRAHLPPPPAAPAPQPVLAPSPPAPSPPAPPSPPAA